MMRARIAVEKKNERCVFELSESACNALSIRGALMFGERIGLTLMSDDPSPLGVRFNVDG